MADELLRYTVTRQRNNREVRAEMWMCRCAACRRLLRKSRLCDKIRCECGRKWYLQWHNGLSSTYLRGSEDRADNRFRQSSAGRSFRFSTGTEACMTWRRWAWCMRLTNPIGKPTRNVAHRSAVVHTLIGRSDDGARFPCAGYAVAC